MSTSEMVAADNMAVYFTEDSSSLVTHCAMIVAATVEHQI